MKLYRYVVDTIGYRHSDMDGIVKHFQLPPKATVSLLEFNVIGETPKGYWIDDWGERKWVSKTSRKRYAYPTLDLAKLNFIKRTESRIRVLKTQLINCEDAMNYIKKEWK